MLAVIALQLAVPVVALLNDPPGRFGFQMYSGLGGVQATVVNAAGHTRSVDLEQVAAEPRPELDWTARLPEYLCSTVDDARMVHVHQSSSSRSLRCRD